jgi:putative flippase GtrA
VLDIGTTVVVAVIAVLGAAVVVAVRMPEPPPHAAQRMPLATRTDSARTGRQGTQGRRWGGLRSSIVVADPERISSGGAVAPPAGMTGVPGPLLRAIRDQRVAFLVVGAMNTAIGIVWFTVFHLLLGGVVHYLVLLVMAHVASVLCAFVLYRRIVFRVQGHVLRDLARFELVYLGGLAVNLALLPVVVEVGGVPVLPAQLLIVGVTAVISFFGHKHFSFRRPAT